MKRISLLFSLLMVPFLMLNAQTTPDGEAGQMQGFARALDISEGYVFVGEPSNYHQPGAVYVFNRDGSEWQQLTSLMATDGTIGDRFGSAVSADGYRMVVGAPQANDRSGAAYVFELSTDNEWVQVAQFDLPEDTSESRMGTGVALSGDMAYVGAPRHNNGMGSVLVYERTGHNEWTYATTIMNPDTATANFGAVLAAEGSDLVVSAPDREAGVVHLFSLTDGEWTHIESMASNLADERSQFGATLEIKGDHILIGAPRNNAASGSVFMYSKNEEGEWGPSGILSAFDGFPRTSFGSSIEFVGSDVWIGAPGGNGREGVIYKFMADEDGMWTGSMKMSVEGLESGDSFASTLAVEGDIAVAGMTGADFGAGTAVFLSKSESGDWKKDDMLYGKSDNSLEPITGGRVDCQEDKAGIYGCDNVDLISFLPISEIGGERGVRLNDIWGWEDPLTGREYALVGRNEGTSFVDVTDAQNPVYIGNLPMTEGSRPNVWRDIKVYKNHAYIVADGAGEHGMQVLDMTQFREFDGEPMLFEETAHYDKIHSAHNVVINEDTGYAFIVGSSGGGNTCGGGLHMVNIQEPANPVFEGCFADPSTGRSGTGYSHDAQCVIYDGPDADYAGREICFGANETAVSIADVTDKENPVAISTATYPDYGYVHQGWLTDDHAYFFQNDELDELMGNVDRTRTIVWDVRDLDDPQLVTEFFIDIPSSDHNLYIKDGKMYQSNYVSGLQVIDVTDPANPKKVGEFDTNPFTDDAPGFAGTWSNYPFFKSGNVIMTSGNEGLFILDTNEEAINQ